RSSPGTVDIRTNYVQTKCPGPPPRAFLRSFCPALQGVHIRPPRAHQRELTADAVYLFPRYLGAQDALFRARPGQHVAPGVDDDGVGVAHVAALLVPRGRAAEGVDLALHGAGAEHYLPVRRA